MATVEGKGRSAIGRDRGAAEAGQKIWTRGFGLAFLVNFAVAISFYMLVTSMALYAITQFQANDVVAGLTASLFGAGSVVGRIFSGYLISILGRRHLLLVSLVVLVVVSVLHLVADGIGLLLVLRGLHGLVIGFGNTAITAGVQDMIPPHRRSEGIGYFALSMSLSAAVGPLLATILGGAGRFDLVFGLTLVLSVAAVLGALVLRLPEAPGGSPRRGLRLSDMFDAATAPVAFLMLLGGLAYSGVLTFLSSYAQQEQLTAAASLFFVVYSLGTLVSRIVLGRIQDRIGDNVVMYTVMSCFTVGLLLLGLVPGPVAVIISGLVSGVGFGGMIPAVQSIVVRNSSPQRLTVAIATLFLMLEGGGAIGPFLLGLVTPIIGFAGMYTALAGLMAFTIVLYGFVHGRRAR